MMTACINRDPKPALFPKVYFRFQRHVVRLIRRDTREPIRQQEDGLVRYRNLFDLAATQAKIGLWDCDLATNTLTWTDGVYDLFELPRASRVTRAEAVSFYDPESRREMEALRARAINEGVPFSLDARIWTAKGNARWMRLTANVDSEGGLPVRLFGMKQDITEERALLERLRRSAETDPLTGLANRAVLEERLNLETGAVLLVDLDGFKQINDSRGHAAGDECLRYAASCLRSACPNDALVARLGGDEFVVVMEIGTARGDIEALSEAILAVLSRPVLGQAHRVHLSGSIGIAVGAAGRWDGARLLQEADMALYAAKQAGRNRSRIFTADLERTGAAA